MAKPTRLITFIELVNGCNNTNCPSYGSVCNYQSQNYMTEKTLTSISNQLNQILNNQNQFEQIDIWTYGCGDSLDHPNITQMLKIIKSNLGHLGKISMAVDSRRNIPAHYCKGKIVDSNSPNKWLLKCDQCGNLFEGTTSNSIGNIKFHECFNYLDKIKIIHKLPESFNWLDKAKLWSNLNIPMSHKLITNHITTKMWNDYISNPFLKELKAVSFHNIQLGTNNPTFNPRKNISFDNDIPVKSENYKGKPVRRVMINFDGSIRRCLVSPTKHKTLNDLIFGEDQICQTCFPLTGSGLVKFFPTYISSTPSASCVSDGYFSPTWE